MGLWLISAIYMYPGIKVGPDDGIEILKKTGAKYVEVWFRLDWQEKYLSLFKYLRQKKINFGLHFWAIIKEKYAPNLLSADPEIADQTYRLIKQTIDIASASQAYYVNFHPESYNDALLDLDQGKIKVISQKSFDKRQSFASFLEHLKKIKQYALKKKVVSFLETVPKFMPADIQNMSQGRLRPQKAWGLETEKFFQLAQMNYPLCLDFGHTMGQLITDNSKELFNYLYHSAQKLKKAVGLIHVTTNAPPFNGTDSHNGILEKDFQQGAVPDRKQLIKLLSLFKDTDVWLIPEPQKGKMIANHYALKKIVSSLGN